MEGEASRSDARWGSCFIVRRRAGAPETPPTGAVGEHAPPYGRGRLRGPLAGLRLAPDPISHSVAPALRSPPAPTADASAPPRSTAYPAPPLRPRLIGRPVGDRSEQDHEPLRRCLRFLVVADPLLIFPRGVAFGPVRPLAPGPRGTRGGAGGARGRPPQPPGGHRHDECGGEAGLPRLRRPGGVRARPHTRAGLESARARGRNGGRPRSMDDQKVRPASRLMRDPEVSVGGCAERWGSPRPRCTGTWPPTAPRGSGSPPSQGP